MTAVRAVAGTAVNLALVPVTATRWTLSLGLEVTRVGLAVGGIFTLAVLDAADALLYGVESA